MKRYWDNVTITQSTLQLSFLELGFIRACCTQWTLLAVRVLLGGLTVAPVVDTNDMVELGEFGTKFRKKIQINRMRPGITIRGSIT